MSAGECSWCGRHKRAFGICPCGDVTPAEHAYIDRILADSAGVYAEEHRAYQAERRAS